MSPRSCRNQRVIDRSARDSEPRELGAKGGCIGLA